MTNYYLCWFVALSALNTARNVAVAIAVGGTVGTTVGSTIRYGNVRYQYRYGTVLNCMVPVPYRTVWYMYRRVRYGTVLKT